MKATLNLIAVSVLAVLFAPASGLAVRAYAQVETPTAVVQAWIDARAAQDLDAAVALLDDNAFLIFTDFPTEEVRVYEGKEQIKQVLRSSEGSDFQFRVTETPNLINGTVAWAEAQSSPGLQMFGVSSVEFFGNAIVEGGKIKSLSYTLTPEAKDALVAAGAAYPAGGTGNTNTGKTITNVGQPGMPTSGLSSLETYLSPVIIGILCIGLGLFLRLKRQGWT